MWLLGTSVMIPGQDFSGDFSLCTSVARGTLENLWKLRVEMEVGGCCFLGMLLVLFAFH